MERSMIDAVALHLMNQYGYEEVNTVENTDEGIIFKCKDKKGIEWTVTYHSLMGLIYVELIDDTFKDVVSKPSLRVIK